MNMNVKKNEVKEAAMMLSSRWDESRQSMPQIPFVESPTAPLLVKKRAWNLSIYNNLIK